MAVLLPRCHGYLSRESWRSLALSTCSLWLVVNDGSVCLGRNPLWHSAVKVHCADRNWAVLRFFDALWPLPWSQQGRCIVVNSATIHFSFISVKPKGHEIVWFSRKEVLCQGLWEYRVQAHTDTGVIDLKTKKTPFTKSCVLFSFLNYSSEFHFTHLQT